MRRLQKLVYLTLKVGKFSIPSTGQLTSLRLYRADVDVSAVAKEGCGLQKLCMVASVVRGLGNGISTFSRLRALSCICADIDRC